MQFYLDKEWLIDVFVFGRPVDFNNYTKNELIQILNYLRLCLIQEIKDGKI